MATHEDIWAIFHDGTIDRVVGTVPGTISLHIWIPYLRKMFRSQGRGNRFLIRLTNCTRLEYTEFDQEPTTDLRAIKAAQPEILSVVSSPPIVLMCTRGELALEYQGIDIALDSGIPIQSDDIIAASQKYWKDWAAKADAAAAKSSG